MFTKSCRRTAFVAATVAVLSSACLTTSGTAAADGYTEWLESIAKLLSHDGVVPIDIARNETRIALTPATRFAEADQTEGERITEAACEYNEKVEHGEKLYGFFRGFTESEREATEEQAAELTKYSAQVVSAICRNSTP